MAPQQEIGSFFALCDLLALNNSPQSPSIYDAISQSFPYVAWSGSGRGALRMAFEDAHQRGVRRLIFPSYLCSSILSAARAAGLPVEFYPVCDQLEVDLESLLPRVDAQTAVLLIDYFGWPSAVAGRLEAFSRHCPGQLVVDVSHSLSYHRLQELGKSKVAYLVGSLRKLYPLPDGGFVASRYPIEYARCDDAVEIGPVLCAMVLKTCFLKGWKIPKDSFLGLFQDFEGYLDRTPVARSRISPLSAALIRLLAVDTGIRQRRSNYSYLYPRLASLCSLLPLFPDLEHQDQVVPFAFPVVCDRRDELRAWLISHGIYPPVHWPLPAEVYREGHGAAVTLSQRMLSLPCDYRYDQEAMERLARTVQIWDREQGANRCGKS